MADFFSTTRLIPLPGVDNGSETPLNGTGRSSYNMPYSMAYLRPTRGGRRQPVRNGDFTAVTGHPHN